MSTLDVKEYTPVDGLIHVEDYMLGDDCAVMRCGIVAYIDDDCIPEPRIDWVHGNFAERGTCPECRTNTKRRAVSALELSAA